jgi:hypothetical protein
MRPDEPVTTWPGSGPAIRKPTAPLARAMSYLRLRWIVPAANINSWRASTMRPLISAACSANSSGVPRPISITSAVRPSFGVAMLRTSGWHLAIVPSARRRAARFAFQPP